MPQIQVVAMLRMNAERMADVSLRPAATLRAAARIQDSTFHDGNNYQRYGFKEYGCIIRLQVDMY